MSEIVAVITVHYDASYAAGIVDSLNRDLVVSIISVGRVFIMSYFSRRICQVDLDGIGIIFCYRHAAACQSDYIRSAVSLGINLILHHKSADRSRLRSVDLIFITVCRAFNAACKLKSKVTLRSQPIICKQTCVQWSDSSKVYHKRMRRHFFYVCDHLICFVDVRKSCFFFLQLNVIFPRQSALCDSSAVSCAFCIKSFGIYRARLAAYKSCIAELTLQIVLAGISIFGCAYVAYVGNQIGICADFPEFTGRRLIRSYLERKAVLSNICFIIKIRRSITSYVCIRR